MSKLNTIKDAFLEYSDGIITSFGSMEEWKGIDDWNNTQIIDAEGGIGLFNGGGTAQLISQFIGALAYTFWAAALAYIFFSILKKSIGLRVTKEEEIEGLDIAEHGIRAYPGKRNR